MLLNGRYKMDIKKKTNLSTNLTEKYLDVNILKENRKEQRKLAFKRFFKNKLAVVGGVVILSILIIAIFHNFLAPYDPFIVNVDNTLASVSKMNPMGTDQFGRDYMSRVFYGAKVSLQVGLVSVSIATLIGLIIGGIAGYYGGWIDNIIMRIMDIVITFPSLLLAVIFVAILGPSVINAMIAIGIIYIPITARVVRATVINNKENDYVEAAKAIGKSNLKILFLEIIPNSLSPLIVQATVTFADAIIIEATLSFLGLSAQPPMASWGKMLNESMVYITTHPTLILFPGIAISLTVMGFNLLGDGLRDILDPTIKD